MKHVQEKSGAASYMSALLHALLVTTLLTSCQPQLDNRDLENWISEINSRPPGRMEPLPWIVSTRPEADRELARNPFARTD